MTDWKRIKRLMATYLCRVERFALAACDTSGHAYLYVPYGFDTTIPESDLESFGNQRGRESDIEIQYVRLEELDGLMEQHDIKTLCVDAVTKPSLPATQLPGVVDMFLPHTCGRRSVSYNNQFPDMVFTNTDEAWSSSQYLIGANPAVKTPITNLRYSPVEFTLQDPHVIGSPVRYTDYMSKAMPDTMVTSSNAYLSSQDTSKDYPVDNIWMLRGVLELIPVHLYQRIVFGEHSMVNRGVGNLYEGSILAPYCEDAAAANAIFDMHVRYKSIAIKYDGETGVADFLGMDNCIFGSDRGLWKLRNVALTIPSKEHGVCECGSHVIIVKTNGPIVEYSNQLNGLKMPYGTAPIYGMLIDQHNDDAISGIVRDIWEDD